MPQTYIMLQSSEPYSLPSDSLLDLCDRNMREYKMNPAKAFRLQRCQLSSSSTVYLMCAKGISTAAHITIQKAIFETVVIF